MNFQVGDRVVYVNHCVSDVGPRNGATGVVAGHDTSKYIRVRFDGEFQNISANLTHEWICLAAHLQPIWIQETDDLVTFDVDAVL